MKRNILFFISIGLLLIVILVYNTLNVEESKKIAFDDSGYILSSSSERYYFQEDETYTTSYDDKIVFYDTEGEKVTLESANFIHYASGNVVSLQSSVLLDLSGINDDPIIYYNVPANKEVKKTSTGYSVKNLNTDIQFEQAIWKVSSNKYLILSNNITINLNNGVTKQVEGYVEIEYSDNAIVNIYNQEISYQTISSNSYIELDDGIKINIGTKIVSQNDINKMALEDMVIDSDDNVTLIDIQVASTGSTDDIENTTDEDTNTVDGSSSGGTTTTTTSTSTQNTTIIGSSSSSNSNGEVSNTTIDIITSQIQYEYVDENESKVDETITLTSPTFKLKDVEISAVGISGTIQITDEEDLLSKNDDVVVQIINNSTGKIVYSIEEAYGSFSIPINIETLQPDTSYTIVASATYTVNDVDYTKNFLYKTFVTSSMGVSISKQSYTDSMLEFNIDFTDDNVESVVVSLLDESGNEVANTSRTIKYSDITQSVTFDGLTSNTNYIARVSQVSYNGIIQEGTNWVIDLSCSTLKEVPTINSLNYSINKRDGTITLYIDDITDNDGAVTGYTYVVYKYTAVQNASGNISLECDTDTVIYQRETTSKEITITVGEEGSDKGIVRGTYYGFEVIANTYDNEKYVEVESSLCGAFIFNGATFPTVKFERVTSDYPPTEICGYIYIIDNEGTVIVDEDNPLTITYYSDVDESVIYTKRYSLETDEVTEDSDGNSVIKIWVDIGAEGGSTNGLKANTSYTFSVYGTVDLSDGNDPYTNTYIGSSIVTTDSYDSITVNLEATSVESNAFTVELSLDANDIEAESLTSVTILMYEGSGDINTGEYTSYSRTLTTTNYVSSIDNAKNNTEVTSLQSLLFDNVLEITPSYIGGGKESSYTEAYYQIVVTATVDGTTYSNKIPVVSADDNNQRTGNTTYTDKTTSQTYSAAYILVNGKGTTAEVTEDLQSPTAVVITNANATQYGLESDSDLENSTAVGYYVSTKFTNTGSLTAKSITYYVWDENGNAVLDESGNAITKTIEFTNQEYAPSAVFELGYGTTNTSSEDNKSGLHRGCAYNFSYTVTYEDSNGAEVIWPTCESTTSQTYDEQSLATGLLYPDKQEPTFVIYPKTSDSSTITYIYSCYDPDKALHYQDGSDEITLLTWSVGDYAIHSDIQVNTTGTQGEFTVDGLVANTTYNLKYEQNLNKVSSSTYSSLELFSQLFEGIVSLNDITISNISYNDSNNPNNMVIVLSGSSMSRVAGAVVTLVSGVSQVSTEIIAPEKSNGNYYVTVNLLDIIDSSNYLKFLNKDIQLKVTVYYDNGIIGFIPTTSTSYSIYANEENTYLSLSNGKFVESDTASGNMYSYTFTQNLSSATLALKGIDAINNNSNAVNVELAYSSAGLSQNSNIVIQKQITSCVVDEGTTYTVNIEDLVLGIQVKNISSTISTATIQATLINPLNIDISSLQIEILHSKDSSGTLNWDNCETRTISVDSIGNFTLEGLSPAEYYYIRFKYEEDSSYIYTYDVDSYEVQHVYTFETLATIGISDVEIEYVAEKYSSKYLDISYSVTKERSNMYEKVKYTFYESDGVTQIKLDASNIIATNTSASYTIEDGSLIVTNPSYDDGSTFSSVEEMINVSPDCNIFETGYKYKLVITPIVTTIDGEECEIENVSETFNMSKLSSPTIGLKMQRSSSTTQYIRAIVTISDTDGTIYGSDWGEYELHVYRYTDDASNRQEVSIYSKSQNGDDLTGQTFNLQNNAKNFSVYVCGDDVDYTYNYVVEVTLKYDYTNSGENLTEHTETYVLKGIDNDADISIGSATLVQNGTSCEIRFYDNYYNIDKINNITYSVYDLTNNTTTTGSYVPKWTLVSDASTDISYYKITLPVTFSTSGTYTIQMNLYYDDTLIGQIDTVFIYSI